MYTSARIVYKPRPNQTVTVEELNEALVQLHIPALIFVAFCIVIGFIGNVVVIYVYKTKFRRSNHRYFILFLGIMDFLACVTGMPFLIASLRLPYMITSSIACKSLRYFHYFVNNSSGLLLVVISIERFRKICHPFKKQLTSRRTLYLCWGTILFSAIMAAPAPVFFTATGIDTGINNITGYECYAESHWFEVYQGVLMVESILSIVIFVVLYAFIIRKLWTNDQFLQAMRSLQIQSSGRSGTDSSYSNDRDVTEDFDSHDNSITTDEDTATSTKPFLSKNGNSIHLQSVNTVKSNTGELLSSSCQDINRSNNNTDDSRKQARSLWRMSRELLKRKHTDDGIHNGKPLKRSVSDVTLEKIKQPKRFHTLTPATRLAIGNMFKDKPAPEQVKPAVDKNKSSKTTVRVTLMLLVVSFAFAISFIPHLSLMIVTAHDDTFLDNLSKTGVMVYQVFLRIFILNNVVNPIIFVFCDTKFRKECKILFRRIFCCK